MVEGQFLGNTITSLEMWGWLAIDGICGVGGMAIEEKQWLSTGAHNGYRERRWCHRSGSRMYITGVGVSGWRLKRQLEPVQEGSGIFGEIVRYISYFSVFYCMKYEENKGNILVRDI